MSGIETAFNHVFINAEIITMDPACPKAARVAVKGGRIALVDDASGAVSGVLNGETTQIVDCRGRTVLPGFIDAHCHMAAYAESLVAMDASPIEGPYCIAEIQARVRDCSTRIPAGCWIRGKGYNEFYISEKRHPNRRDLDAAAPSHPVKLTHRSGHAHVLNSLGLKACGIDAGSEDPPGGIIDRDPETGEPTGILYGMHRYLSGKIPAIDPSELDRGLVHANKKLLSYGITSVQDATCSNSLKQWNRFHAWKERRLLNPRLTMMQGTESFAMHGKNTFVSRLPDTDLRPGGIKIMAERVTGSLCPPQDALNELVASIHMAGRQVAVHALEEPVVKAAVEAIRQALRLHPRTDSRHRIEHCSVCSPALLKRLAELGCMVVTQPTFLFSEGERYLEKIPDEDLPHLYPLAAMIESGLRIAAGADAPIADPNPMTGIGAAVTRLSKEGRRLPQQGIDLDRALRMYTVDAAAANFEEDIKGSIAVGKLADFVVLDQNPFRVSLEKIRDIRVIMTVIAGEIVWRDPDAWD
jgi:predicted amidohydrolase YtcJ